MPNGIPQGKLVVGRYAGVETARRRPTEQQATEGKPGNAVPGFYLLKLVSEIGEAEREYELSFFETDEDGERTKISRTVAEGTVNLGDLVAVRFKSAVSKQRWVSDTATSMVVLEKAK